MRRHYLIISIICFIIGAYTLTLLSATGTPSSLVVRTDANNYLLVTSVTQTNPVTQGVFASRTLRTDSSGSLQVVLTGTVTPTYPMSIPASTCAAPSLGESGAATTGIAFTATPSILECVSGTARGTLTASSYTLTVPILEADGSASAPSYSFTSETSTGYKWRSSSIDSVIGGSVKSVLFSGGQTLASSAALGWSSGDPSSVAADTIIAREGAGHLFQRNTTNAQRASWANTYVSTTSYESFSVDWQTTANTAIVGTRTAATGTSRTALFGSQATNGGGAFTGMAAKTDGAPFLRLGVTTTAIGAASTASTGNYVTVGELTTEGSTSGSRSAFAILPTYNQSSGTAANTDLLINRTQTAVGSGIQKLIDLQIGSVVKHYITADGTAKGTQEVFIQATAPTCTSANNCGTGNGTFSTGSNDTAGSVTLGTTPASGFVITFNGTWVAAPVCSVWMNKAGMVVGKMPLTTVTTTTTITVVTNGTAPATGDIYAYRCTGIQ